MKHAILFASLMLAAQGCIPEAPTSESAAAKKPQPDLANPPDLTPPPDLAVECPTFIDCHSAVPTSGSGWWVGTTSYSAPTLTCNWASLNPPYYTITWVYAPAGCQNCVWTNIPGRYTCTAG